METIDIYPLIYIFICIRSTGFTYHPCLSPPHQKKASEITENLDEKYLFALKYNICPNFPPKYEYESLMVFKNSHYNISGVLYRLMITIQ